MGVLATGRADGSPQQSVVGYTIDGDDRLVISAKAYTAKWRNAQRQPRVCVTVADRRAAVIVYGTADCIDRDPLRAELTADVFAAIAGEDRPEPAALVPTLDGQQRTVLRITPRACSTTSRRPPPQEVA